MINCPNPNCQTANPEGTDICQACQAALPHHYLWGVGDLVTSLKPGTLLHQRYLLKRDHTFLDTKPGVLPESLPEVPNFLLPYLHLSAFPLHVPRPYSVLRTPDKDHVVMLESAALSIGAQPDIPGMLPKLVSRWAEAPPLRQLSWLSQIAQLWDAFVAEQVAATLLDSELLRVDGSILRLLELKLPSQSFASTSFDRDYAAQSTNATKGTQPTLMDLARSWQPLADKANQAVKSFLRRLCEQLESQQLNAEQLCEQLSQAITVCGQGQSVTYDMAVYTDQGPTRKRNEDACFPESGTTAALTSDMTQTTPELLIVCDGIGGHQGGDVASKLAITTIKETLAPVLTAPEGDLTSTELTLAIEAAICAANDEISAQNDRAQRQARDRMGTTLVLALVKGANVYIAHLGDSRAYRISSRNCQQVTLDDDVASRQVRLGGSLYREVLMQPGSGSLIQALGMGPSQALRPTVQRFVMDENCVFLLCSDGLSDSDRVEQFWRYILKPMVTGTEAEQRSSAFVGPRLVQLANKYNGHDNVTVGLLNVQIVRGSDRKVPQDITTSLAGHTAATPPATTQRPKGSGSSKAQGKRPITQLTPIPSTAVAAPTPSTSQSTKGTGHSVKKAGIVAVLLLLSGTLAFFMLPELRGRLLGPVLGPAATVSAENELPISSAPETSSSDSDTSLPPKPLEVGNFARIRPTDSAGIRTSAPGETDTADYGQIELYASPELGAQNDSNEVTATIASGGIVQLLNKQATDERSVWVQVRVCSIPSGDRVSEVPSETDTPNAAGDEAATVLNAPESTQTLLLDPGKDGWVLEANLMNNAELIQDLQPDQKESCES
ncbi:MAG: protein phosphatase 2C domain-containing protein [Cyanobacteria bacterium J06632_3]